MRDFLAETFRRLGLGTLVAGVIVYLLASIVQTILVVVRAFGPVETRPGFADIWWLIPWAFIIVYYIGKAVDEAELQKP